MTINVHAPIKNEVDYIGFSIMSLLDHVDEFVYFDGNSTDGTVKLIKHIQQKYDKENKIKLFENQDCKNFTTDYMRLYNDCLKKCTSDWVIAFHPDMIALNPEVLRKNIGSPRDAIRYHFNVTSFCGDGKKCFTAGREPKWGLIYKNDYGLHQYGVYGAVEEDYYFREITGNEHRLFREHSPYFIYDSGLNVNHYSENKDYDFRLNKMIKVLSTVNPKMSKEVAIEKAKKHPRVTLKDGGWLGGKISQEYIFKIDNYGGKQPKVFKKYEYFKEFKK